MGREDLAGVESDDRDRVLVDDGQDPPTGTSRANVDVGQAPGPAQADGALPIGHVVAEPEVAPRRGSRRPSPWASPGTPRRG